MGLAPMSAPLNGAILVALSLLLDEAAPIIPLESIYGVIESHLLIK